MGRKKKIREILDPLTVENPEPVEEFVQSEEPTSETMTPLPPAPPPEFKRVWRFVSNTYLSFSVGFKGKMHQFQNGVLETDDPEFARELENHRWFRVHFHRG